MFLPVVTIADFIAAGDQSGCFALSRATIPETCGVAIEVPDCKANPLGYMGSKGELAARMPASGAPISGCFSTD